jgi:ferredoxin-NADP reductase
MKQPISWQIATVKSIHPETPQVKTITLTLPDWLHHRPGQHYDLRLTARMVTRPSVLRSPRNLSVLEKST